MAATIGGWLRPQQVAAGAVIAASHPVPGTYPVVMTGEADWGGWRVPGAEYDLNPAKVEEQARLIASAPQLASFATGLVEWARKSGEEMPSALVDMAHNAQDLLSQVALGSWIRERSRRWR